MSEAAKLKILFLASQPQNAGGLHLDWDLQAFNRALDTTRTADRFLPRFLWGPSPADLIDNLSLFKPDIVHFSGHGQQAAQDKELGIGLVDRTRQTAVVAEQGLLSLLRGLGEDRPQLLVLASCWGQGIARSATAFVKCGIGCPGNMSDTVASSFIHGFYASIAAGRSVRNSYEIGLSGIPDTVPFDRRPMLEWAPDADPSKIYLLPAPEKKDSTYTEIHQLLDLGLFPEVAFRAETGLRKDPANASLLYYLALSRLNGRLPRNLVNLEEARSIDSLLDRSLKISTLSSSKPPQGRDWRGCALLLRAWIQEDLFQRRGFSASDTASLDFLLQRASELFPEASELRRLSRVIPSTDRGQTRNALDRLIVMANNYEEPIP